jgi:hypothetical protein
MAKTTAKLKVLEPTGLDPPRTLGNHGRNLWLRITSEYDLSDAGGRELLVLICQALDRAEALREQIDAEGEVQKVKGVLRDHPALRHELQNRSFIAKGLARLGLAVEVGPIRNIGRPVRGGIGILDTDLPDLMEDRDA